MIRTTINISLISCMALFFLLSTVTTAVPQDKMVRAKIGVWINSEDKQALAKSRDRLKARDLLRIYVQPMDPAFVYVVYTDKKDVVLLNDVKNRTQKETLVLPSTKDYYEIDGNSRIELFTIICSINRIPELDHVSSYEQWAALEKKLALESKVLFTEKSKTPYTLAGNIRGTAKPKTTASIVGKLHVMSGDTLVVKKYEFRIKK